MSHQFNLHIILSLGIYSTEFDFLQRESLHDYFEYAIIIGNKDDMVSLQYYSNNVSVKFIEEQLGSSPYSIQIIYEWIQISGELFDEVIIHNNIPIT